MKLYLKLRNNIVLDGDLLLAEREIKHLCGSFRAVKKSDIDTLVPFISKEHATSFIRDGEIIGYIVEDVLVTPECFVKYLSFIQEIWTSTNETFINGVQYCVLVDGVSMTVPVMAMSELLFYSKDIDNHAIDAITSVLSLKSKDTIKSVQRVLTSTPHVHSFHAYKAKFFPRFVRSLIVSNLDLSSQSVNVCDPYVGSGTTLVESSLMGFNSLGIDIDPLSCMISSIKTDALSWDLEDIAINFSFKQLKTENEIKYKFPEEIHKKFVRWGKEDEEHEYESQISRELNKIYCKDGILRQLYKISLSDALTKKFNIRMMGTGSGRFALEIAKKSLKTILDTNYKNQVKALSTIKVLKEAYNLAIIEPTVLNGDAVKRDVNDNTFDIIVTSPPYLPASSGREDYVVGKLISLKAMGLLENIDKKFYTGKSVGSMDNVENIDLSGLPSSVSELYQWLLNDELRCIKAKPVVSYYNSLKKSLQEDRRTIKKGGKIIYIIGKESVFYSSTTKEILYKIECDNIFIELAREAGLKVDEVINIELDKKNVVARPRSTDKYYECAIIMSKR